MALDAIAEFFFGTPPLGLEPIYYVFRCAIGLLLFDYIFDIFRFARKLFGL